MYNLNNDPKSKEEIEEKLESFNYLAFLFSFIWSLVKKLYMAAFITIVLALGVFISRYYEVAWMTKVLWILIIVFRFCLGYYGNKLVWNIENETDPMIVEKRKNIYKYAIAGLIIVGGAYLYIVGSVLSDAMK